MRKYKLNNESKKELTQEQVNKHKNFSKLVANYDRATKYSERKPFYKDPKAFLALIIILLILWLLLMDEKEDSVTPTPPVNTEIQN